MLSQAVVSIFSYSFIFLLGVILGAVGELIWNGRAGKSSSPADPVSPQRIEIPQINVDLPGDSRPAVTSPVSVPETPVQVVAPVLDLPISQPAVKPVKEDAKKPVKMLSIVEQVDEILQELQKFTKSTLPLISLMDDGKQGVLVKMGNQTYPGIDAVPNQEAQDLIRQAVSEWERRSAHK